MRRFKCIEKCDHSCFLTIGDIGPNYDMGSALKKIKCLGVQLGLSNISLEVTFQEDL